jgi:hypothetical protein
MGGTSDIVAIHVMHACVELEYIYIYIYIYILIVLYDFGSRLLQKCIKAVVFV